MNGSFSLPLRPSLPQTKKQNETLPLEIAQINAQYGSFREITEQGLQDQLEAYRTSGREIEDEDKTDSSSDRPSERTEQLFKSRLEILDFAM